MLQVNFSLRIILSNKTSLISGTADQKRGQGKSQNTRSVCCISCQISLGLSSGERDQVLGNPMCDRAQGKTTLDCGAGDFSIRE